MNGVIIVLLETDVVVLGIVVVVLLNAVVPEIDVVSGVVVLEIDVRVLLINMKITTSVDVITLDSR